VVLHVDKLYGGYSIRAGDRILYVDAVSGVTLSAYTNEVVGIAGESGSGKTTLVKIIYGLVRPPLVVKSGSVYINTEGGRVDVLSVEDKRRIWWKYISYIPQNSMNVFNPVQKIKDHFAETLKTHLGVRKEEAYEMAGEYLEKIGLSREVLNSYPHQLSGGMRQRIAIALALILRPKVVLADEPTTALDVVVQRGILQMLLEKQRELKNTLIIVTHDMGIHAMLTDRLMIMYAGKVAEVGNTHEVFQKPLHPYTQALISSLPRIGDKSVRRGLHGMPPNLANPPLGCRFHPRCPFAMDICRRSEPPLMEVGAGRLVSCWLYGGV